MILSLQISKFWEDVKQYMKKIDGWKESTVGIKDFKRLPAKAKKIYTDNWESCQHQDSDYLDRTTTG